MAKGVYKLFSHTAAVKRANSFKKFEVNHDCQRSELQRVFGPEEPTSGAASERLCGVLDSGPDGLVTKGNVVAYEYTLEDAKKYISCYLAFKYCLGYLCKCRGHLETGKIGDAIIKELKRRSGQG